jgi:hypothetical protein
MALSENWIAVDLFPKLSIGEVVLEYHIISFREDEGQKYDPKTILNLIEVFVDWIKENKSLNS